MSPCKIERDFRQLEYKVQAVAKQVDSNEFTSSNAIGSCSYGCVLLSGMGNQ